MFSSSTLSSVLTNGTRLVCQLCTNIIEEIKSVAKRSRDNYRLRVSPLYWGSVSEVPSETRRLHTEPVVGVGTKHKRHSDSSPISSGTYLETFSSCPCPLRIDGSVVSSDFDHTELHRDTRLDSLTSFVEYDLSPFFL